MTTPHVEKLGLIGPWAPAAHDAISDGLDRVAQHLETVAMRTRSIAGELGFEGQMADTTRENLDKLQARVVDHSDGIKRVSTARRQVVEVGRQAQFQYGEIRRNVDAANAARDSAVALAPAAGPVAAPMIVAHANAVHQAAMGVLDVQALAVLKGLDVNTFDAMGKLPPFAQLEGLKQEVESKLKVKLPSVQEVQDAFQKFDQAVKLFDQVRSFFMPPASSEPTAATAPTRSATEWHSGPRMDGGGLSLQSSHYSMPSVQAGHAVSQPSMLHSPAVFNPMSTAAAAATGGAAAASYKLYQAAKAAQVASAPQSASSALRSGATMRVQSPGSGSGILRGTTTAARAEASATASRGLGGASGAARPTSSSSARTPGITRGATTAARAKASTQTRGSGILKGTTTAKRAKASTQNRTAGMGASRTAEARTAGTRTGSARAASTAARNAASETRNSKARRSATGLPRRTKAPTKGLAGARLGIGVALAVGEARGPLGTRGGVPATGSAAVTARKMAEASTRPKRKAVRHGAARTFTVTARASGTLYRVMSRFSASIVAKVENGEVKVSLELNEPLPQEKATESGVSTSTESQREDSPSILRRLVGRRRRRDDGQTQGRGIEGLLPAKENAVSSYDAGRTVTFLASGRRDDSAESLETEEVGDSTSVEAAGLVEIADLVEAERK